MTGPTVRPPEPLGASIRFRGPPVELPDPALGPRQVDVEELYNAERYRPLYSDKLGAPLLLSTV